jgi:acyl-CoA thioesterase YciA
VRVGDVVSIHATIEREGRTSMTIAAEVWVTRQPEGRRLRVTEGRFVFVAVGADGGKRPLP